MRLSRVLASALPLGLLAAISTASLAAAQTTTVTVNIGPGRDAATATGTATLTAMGDKTRVVLNVGTASPNMPAHIHADACPGVGPVVFPLNNVMNGTSTTELDAPLSDVLARGKSINVHLSPQQAGVFVGCGNIQVAGAQAAPTQLPRTGELGSVAGLIGTVGAGLLAAGYALRKRFGRRD